MASKATSYKCPNCTAPLKFSSETGRLGCEYCDSSFTAEEIEAFYAAKDAKAAEAATKDAPRAERGEVPQTAADIPEEEKIISSSSAWDESTISDDWGEDSKNVVGCMCPSCGAEMMTEATSIATRCPYCGNENIKVGEIAGALKPDLIIPFTLNKEAAIAAFKEHCQKKWFVPSDFKSNNELKKIQGIYVPFWLFDGKVAAQCRYEGIRTRRYIEGDYEVTETEHYDVARSGNVAFAGVPADASKKMPDDLMDSVEPFDYSALKPFSTAYLPGFLADRYDVSIKEAAGRADKRCVQTAYDLMRGDAFGYEELRTRQENAQIERGKVHYALLPVWVIKTKWQDKSYLFAMNGQTGKFVGDLPVSQSAFWKACLGIFVVLTVVFYAAGIGDWLAQILWQ